MARSVSDVLGPVLAAEKPAKANRSGTVWSGPSAPGDQGGVTQSLLGRFLCCRERFRLLVVKGLKAEEGFRHKLEYGNLWHAAEEGLAAAAGRPDVRLKAAAEAAGAYARQLLRDYPMEREKVEHWYRVCLAQFPAYADFWSKHPDVKNRTPLLSEQVFDVRYPLPSGRSVRLRGKWDSVDLVTEGGVKAVWLQENKTKGDVWEPQLKRQLTFDLQTMVYLVALGSYDDNDFWQRVRNEIPGGGRRPAVAGVRYNVIRRPLSGGKYSIIRHKPRGSKPGETADAYYTRLADLIEDDPAHFFMRWSVTVMPGDVVKFRRECLDPVLENLCDDWEWWEHCARVHGDVWRAERRNEEFPHHRPRHYRHPFGVYNPLDEGRATDLDEMLATGSEHGLRRVDTLFPELAGPRP